MKKLLITGGMGFIGSNFILHIIERYEQYFIYNLDLLTYAANPRNLSEIEKLPNYRFVQGDIADPEIVGQIFSEGIDYVINFAAETHVDRSIQNSRPFVHTNLAGAQNLLDASKKHGIAKFVQISTDEVYGSLGATGKFSESSPLAPNSPYSSSKAGADLLALSYHHTFGLPVVISRCSNNYGPRQHTEKWIPTIITKILDNECIPVYGNGLNVRDWLHVKDHCRAIDFILHNGKPGEIYNVGGNNERTNIEIARRILKEMGQSDQLIKFVKDRPGHDWRYAIDASKMKKDLEWEPIYDFEQGLRETINWYVKSRKENPH